MAEKVHGTVAFVGTLNAHSVGFTLKPGHELINWRIGALAIDNVLEEYEGRMVKLTIEVVGPEPAEGQPPLRPAPARGLCVRARALHLRSGVHLLPVGAGAGGEGGVGVPALGARGGEGGGLTERWADGLVVQRDWRRWVTYRVALRVMLRDLAWRLNRRQQPLGLAALCEARPS